MRYHWLRLRATAHATEDADRVAQAIQNLSTLEEGFEDVCEATRLESQHGTENILLEARLTKARQIRDCLDHLLVDKATLLEELDRRTDDDGVFYLRFDKQAAYLGEVVPTLGEDAIQVRLRIEAHPATRENAMAALTDLLHAERA